MPELKLTQTPLHITQISTRDIGGGADRVASNLHQGYRQQGHAAHLLVGWKAGDDPTVTAIPNHAARPAHVRMTISAADVLRKNRDKLPAIWRLNRALRWLAQPVRQWQISRGFENHDHPGSHQILDLTPTRPDIIHAHNMHGGYFDLRMLPALSRALPFMITMHDAWLLSGHCAHSLDCDRWQTGCGACPHLDLYPAVPRDRTHINWQRKRNIYQQSQLYVSTPCQWLMNKVERSILADGIIESRVIPYGVDLNIFKPADKAATRDALGLGRDTKMLLFAAAGIRKNVWKDYQMLRKTVQRVAAQLNGQPLLFIALGDDAPPQRIGNAEIRFAPFNADPKKVAQYYQATDLYIHAAKADTFPNTVLEALACGTAVVATEVGGIPEQIDQGKCGYTVPAGDADAMAQRIVQLLNDSSQLTAFCEHATVWAKQRYDLKQHVQTHLNWYEQIMCNNQARRMAA